MRKEEQIAGNDFLKKKQWIVKKEFQESLIKEKTRIAVTRIVLSLFKMCYSKGWFMFLK